MIDFNTNLLQWGQTRSLCAFDFTHIIETESIESTVLYVVFPGLSWLYTEWEKEFRWYKVHQIFCSVTPILPIVSCILYALLCTVGRRYMANRQPFDLRWVLFAWNLLLSIFSFVGFMRIMPHLIMCIQQYRLRTLLTTNPLPYFGYGPTGLWLYLFVFSKVPELGDTVFIILRKKPLLFLHWYHHVSVLLYCWHSLSIHSPCGIIFAAMNYGVHFIMYLYYSMTTFKIHICPPSFVTTLQISQMFVGIAICYVSWCCYLQGEGDTYLSSENLVTGSIMYISYAILFLQYAIKRFWKSKLKTTSKYPPQQPQRPLKEMVKKNGIINNGYHHIGVDSVPTTTVPFKNGSKLFNGGMTLPLKNDIPVEISMPNTKDMSLNNGMSIMTANGVSNGHVQMAYRRRQKLIE